MNVIHFTHTDVTNDSRILKEVESISKLENIHFYAIGIVSDLSINNIIDLNKIKIIQKKCFSNKLSFLPRAIRYIFSTIEVNIKFIILALKIKPDVVHCHDTLVLPVGVLSKILWNSVLVYDAHELESKKGGQNWILSYATFLIEKISWPYVDYFISVSQSIIDWYHAKFNEKPSTLILNAPVKNSSFLTSSKYSSQYLREKYKIPDSSLIYIYIGSLVKGRGIDLFLPIFMSDEITSHLVFLGEGPMAAEIRKASSGCMKIHIHEAVDHSEVIRLARTADVGMCLIEPISLSDYYALPNKLFEYLDSGLHVICSDMPEISRIVNENRLGTVSDLSVDALKNTILYQQAQKPSRNDLFIEELSWASQERKLNELYLLIKSNKLVEKTQCL